MCHRGVNSSNHYLAAVDVVTAAAPYSLRIPTRMLMRVGHNYHTMVSVTKNCHIPLALMSTNNNKIHLQELLR